MTKTFTCAELGGVCDEKFSGSSLLEITEKAMPHMMSDEAHKEKIMNMGSGNGETKEQWMERMQKEFDAKSED